MPQAFQLSDIGLFAYNPDNIASMQLLHGVGCEKSLLTIYLNSDDEALMMVSDAAFLDVFTHEWGVGGKHESAELHFLRSFQESSLGTHGFHCMPELSQLLVGTDDLQTVAGKDEGIGRRDVDALRASI